MKYVEQVKYEKAEDEENVKPIGRKEVNRSVHLNLKGILLIYILQDQVGRLSN